MGYSASDGAYPGPLSPGKKVGIGVGVVIVFLLLVMGIGACGSLYTPNSGDVTVVRNGKSVVPSDWFDNHKIRQVVQNGAGNTWIGFGSQTHPYPASSQQRYFRMQTDAQTGDPTKNSDSAAVTVPTSDGVEVTVSGTFYFYTAFDGSPRGDRLVQSFDTQFGTRTFSGKHVYGGQPGFSAWLGVIAEPIIANNLRSSISGVTCAELLSSCALVQNANTASGKTNQLAAGKANQSNIARIQDEVAANLKADLAATLGAPYFRDIKFQIAGVTPPDQIQKAINNAQAAFAQISQAQAKIKSAQADAEANRQRESGYEQCPACATIDALKAIPSSVTTFAPGSGFAITQQTGK